MNSLKVAGLSVLFVTASIAVKVLFFKLFGSLAGTNFRVLLSGMVALAAVVAISYTATLPSLAGGPFRRVLFPALTARNFLRLGNYTLVGGGIFLVVLILVVGSGGLELSLNRANLAQAPGVILLIVLATVVNAAWEEYTFRGWPFLVSGRAINPHVVAVFLSLTFGMAHILNPNWSFSVVFSISMAGAFLCYSMLASNNILIPIGLHIGWNLVQYILFTSNLWVIKPHSNPLLSGGAYGLENSLVGITVTTLVAGIAFVKYITGRGRLP